MVDSRGSATVSKLASLVKNCPPRLVVALRHPPPFDSSSEPSSWFAVRLWTHGESNPGFGNANAA